MFVCRYVLDASTIAGRHGREGFTLTSKSKSICQRTFYKYRWYNFHILIKYVWSGIVYHWDYAVALEMSNWASSLKYFSSNNTCVRYTHKRTRDWFLSISNLRYVTFKQGFPVNCECDSEEKEIKTKIQFRIVTRLILIRRCKRVQSIYSRNASFNQTIKITD